MKKFFKKYRLAHFPLIVGVLLCLLLPVGAFSAIYYVDTAADGDAGAGTSTAANVAWKTIAKVNASSFSAGDSILFKRGGTWREQLTVPSSGSAGSPITFGAYGSGSKPRILGSDVPSSWTLENYGGSSAPTNAQTSVENTATTNTVTTSFTNTPTQGNLMVAVGGGNTNVTGAAISGWTLAVSAQNGSTNYVGIWYKIAGAAESKDVVLTWTSSTVTGLIISEWTSIDGTPLDKTAKTDTTGGAVNSRSSGTTDATTANDELLIAGWQTGNTITTRSLSNSFSFEFQNDTKILFKASKIVSSTGAQETTLSWTSSARIAGGCIATFKGATGTPVTLYYSSQAAEPETVWFIATDGSIHWGSKKSSKATLAAEYDWWFDDPNNRLYVFAASDPLSRYSSVEVSVAATRSRGIFWSATGNDYITIDGFEIAFVTGVGIVMKSHSIIQNCEVHHIGDETGGHAYGIELQTGLSSQVINNLVYEAIRAGIYVVPYYDNYIIDNCLIENNTVYDCYGQLIYLRADTPTTQLSGAIVRRNNLYHNTGFVPTTLMGIGIDFNGISGVPADGFLINNNKIDTIRAGINIGNYSTDALIYNNTIKSALGRGVAVSGTGTSGIVIKNNIVSNAGLYGLAVVDAGSISACDYNIWYAPGATAYVLIGATAYHSNDFAAYKSDSSWDAHGFWQDPLLTATYALGAGSPAIDAGVPLWLYSAFPGDFYGNKIYGSAPDIGAIEKKQFIEDDLTGDMIFKKCRSTNAACYTQP